MALSLILEQAGFKADEMDTKAEITLEKQGDGFAITKSHLTLRAKIPGMDDAKFKELAGMAEKKLSRFQAAQGRDQPGRGAGLVSAADKAGASAARRW